MDNIDNLARVSEVLEELGYNVKHSEDSVQIALGSTENPFVAVLTVSNSDELVFTCQVAKLGDLVEDEIPAVQFFLLDANTKIRPFAFGILTASDNAEYDEAENYPIVLTDSLPMGDLSVSELASEMDSLYFAIESGSEALRMGLKA